MAAGKVEVMWNIIISELTRVVRFTGKVDEVVVEVRFNPPSLPGSTWGVREQISRNAKFSQTTPDHHRQSMICNQWQVGGGSHAVVLRSL